MEEAQQIAAQLRKPSGEASAIVAERMNQSNQPLIEQSYGLLAAVKGECLLEVGPGSGIFLKQLIEAVGPQGHVMAVDYSAEMVQTVRGHYPNELASGRLSVIEGNLMSLPFKNASFDAICSNNTLYFWDDTARCLSECYRVLKPGGRLVLGFRSRQAVSHMPFTRHGFTLYSPAEAASLLESGGFEIAALKRIWYDKIEGIPLDAIALMAKKTDENFTGL